LTGRALQSQWLTSIDQIEPSRWNALAGDYPFIRHEFLAALEQSGAATPATGWSPRHLLISQGERLLAAAPLYLKSHSWGEFVFDFAWARAWEARGLDYYPKLLLAIPFTPATGPRLLCAEAEQSPALRQAALSAISTLARAHGWSSAHALFIDEGLRHEAERAGWLLRRDCHFQWHNHDYADFEAFLATFSSDKRKKVHRERRRIAEQGIEFQTLHGGELDAAQLATIDAFHAATFERHGHLPYVKLGFFRAIARTMGERFIVKLALQHGQPVACALFFRSHDTLYGRYWGAGAQFHSLHFETCYYQGIDYCIAEGLKRFEPGTQGEHKLARGFEPTLTWSAHWIGDAALRRAVESYLAREALAIDSYAAEAARHTPFRATDAAP
jgi:predicted N-acyltransferase